MHDPLVVAFEVKRPLPKVQRGPAGQRRLYWPPIVTVWHREPDGRDSGEVCKHYRKTQQPDGTWKMTILHGWKLHLWHWKIQVHGLQALRRRMLTRCAWCHGRHSRHDPVNNSRSWDGPKARWWQGEHGLYHGDCLAVAAAHAVCTCFDPVCESHSAEHGPYGRCARCGKNRSFGAHPEALTRQRELALVRAGERPPAGGRV